MIEKVVAEYIQLQERLHKKDGCSMRWQFLATKAMKVADALGIQNFNALADGFRECYNTTKWYQSNSMVRQMK